MGDLILVFLIYSFLQDSTSLSDDELDMGIGNSDIDDPSDAKSGVSLFLVLLVHNMGNL